VFKRLQQYGLNINLEKSVFNKQIVRFLGYDISANGIAPTKEKVAAIQQYEKPKTTKDLRRFLDVINYYRRFIPKAAEHQATLNDCIKQSKKNQTSSSGMKFQKKHSNSVNLIWKTLHCLHIQ